MVPLQSLSLASQISGDGPVEPLQTTAPLLQVVAPARHSPMQPARVPPGQLLAQAMPTRGSWAVVTLSSIAPLQSLSSPSQVSGEGPTEPEHTLAPFAQASVPGRHWPTQLAGSPPGHAEPHAVPTSIGLSSTVPLQLLSRPSQVSGCGPTV